MLTPAVRTEADNYAASQGAVPDGSMAFTKLAEAYEVGYCAGYQARPHRQPYPVRANVELVRRLAPYLAEQIEVYHPGSGCYGLLKGLPYALAPGAECVADVEWYLSAETLAEDGGGGDSYARPGALLPVLYDHNDYESEITLPDGTHIIAVNQVCSLLGLYDKAGKRTALALLRDAEYLHDLSVSGLKFTDLLAAGQMLQQYGFAVGLTPDQYQRRVAGHDYRRGAPGRPLGAPVSSCPCEANSTWEERKHWPTEAIMGREPAPGCQGCPNGKEGQQDAA